MVRRNCHLAIIPVQIAMFLSGCGGEKNQAVERTAAVPVKGKVSLKGKPMTQGSISFEPIDGGREAHGTIGADGTFSLSTFKADDGAIRGSHRIAVKASGGGKKDLVPLKYQSYSSSGIEIEVSDGKTDYPIDLK
ncbi:MAG: carboxypeptidase regulatory-like domain-containing protein [Planctomycetota bacterium]|nr:MAG: carboxypeptidase regulatory-like domain-containing protein [Planctomycetota bacterium]